MDPQMYGQLIFHKVGKNIQWNKDNLFSSDMQKNEPGPLSYTIHKIKPKWMKDLNLRQEDIKIFEEKTGNNLFDLSCSNFLLDTSPETREQKYK